MDALLRTARGGFAAAAIVLSAAMTAAGPTAADESSIGVYADPQGTQPCIDIARGSMATLYLVATPAGQSAGGLTGAEFRIRVTHPEGYQPFSRRLRCAESGESSQRHTPRPIPTRVAATSHPDC